MAGRKRVYAGAPSMRMFKKRKFRRRFKRRGRKTSSYSTKSGSGGRPITYVNRKFRPRVWRRDMWKDTQYKQHFRSADVNTGTITTGTTLGLGSVTLRSAMESGDPFFETDGGAIDPDGGVVPTFKGDIVVRGGRMSLTLTNTSTDDPVRVVVNLMWTVSNPTFAAGAFTGFPTVTSLDGDVTDTPEFRKKYGRLYRIKTMDLEPLTSFTVEKRIPIMKIDQVTWTTVQGSKPFWEIECFNLKDSTDVSITQISSFSLSFVGDAQ